MTIEDFIEKCQKRDLSTNPMERIKILARELAEGAALGIWQPVITNDYVSVTNDRDQFAEYFTNHLKNANQDKADVRYDENIEALAHYLRERWNSDFPSFPLLVNNNYITFKGRKLILLEKAFDLINESSENSVFISYKRSESSAFALLLSTVLKQYGIEPFVDMQLQAGADWQAELEQNIKHSDYFIVLLGNQTLASAVTIKEIQWAIEGDVTLIPIWHNGFEFKAKEWTKLPNDVSQALSNTHTIRVLEENPLTYDTALRELLNRFGIST